MFAAIALVKQFGAQILENSFFIELKFLNEREKLKGYQRGRWEFIEADLVIFFRNCRNAKFLLNAVKTYSLVMTTSHSTNLKSGDWLTSKRFAMLLAVLVLASYPQVLLGLQTFVYRDFGHYSYPTAYYLRESFWRGEMPLWNPLSSHGIPFFAQWATQALYPPALFYVLLPLSWSLAVFCLVHLYVGGLGMFFLTRRWTGNNFAAAFAAITFAFSGLMVNSLIWPPTIAAFGLMPWVVLLTQRAWREGGRKIVTAVIVGATQMLSGGVEVVLMTWLLLGLICLLDFFSGDYPRLKLLCRGTLMLLLISGITAVQLLPFFDFIHQSHRQANFEASIWPMPTTGLANFLSPLFHSFRSFHGVFAQAGQYWISSYYVGVATIALALWAIWRVRDRRVWSLAVMTLFCLVLAVGDASPVYRFLREHISVVSLMRFPVKFVILPVFALPILAAFALAKKSPAENQPNHSTSDHRHWWIICFGIFGLSLFILWSGYHFNRPVEVTAQDLKFTSINGAIRLLFFAVIIGLLWAIKKTSRYQLRFVLQMSLLLLVWLDVSHHAPLPITINRSYYDPNLPRSLPLAKLSRAMISPLARAEFEHLTYPDPADNFLRHRVVLLNNCNLLDNIPKVDSLFPLRTQEQEYVSYVLYGEDSTNAPPAPLLDFLGVSQITSATNLFTWDLRTNFMALISGGQRPIFASDHVSVQGIASNDFNPRSEVYLPLEAKSFVTVTNNAEVKITEIKFAAQQIESTIETDTSALIVIAQTFYHPWKAYLDSEPKQLYRANLGFQALQVPAGKHKLTIVYEDRQFYLGAIISITSLIICGILFGISRRIAI